MIRRWLPTFILVVLAVLVALIILSTDSDAQAQITTLPEPTLVDELQGELTGTNVYVSPAVPDTDRETDDILRSYFKPGDRIYVVMLPEEALDYFDGDAATLARQLDDPVVPRIIVLSVGDEVVSYSRILPAGIAADLLHRAETVSVTPLETVTTFIQNVRDWQAQNPDAPASKTPTEEDEGRPLWVYFVGIALLISIILLIANIWQRNKLEDVESEMRFRDKQDQWDRIQKGYQ